MVREATRAGVQIHIRPFIEMARLLRAGDFFDDVAGADGEAAAAGAFLRFEHDDVVAGLAQLVRGRQSGNACAEDDDAFAGAVGR